MMATFEFNLANNKDEPQLRQLMRSIYMDGAIRISFQKEPNYFDASQVEGREVQTIVMRETDSQQIIGLGNRAIKSVYMNGQLDTVGYLSSLRGIKEFRGSSGLAKGYRYFKKCHEKDQKAKIYLTTIIEDNHYARNTLESGRCGLPDYYDIGRFCASAVGLNQRNIFKCTDGCLIRNANQKDIPQIVEFLNLEGRNRQFFPYYTIEDFTKTDGILHGLPAEDIILAYQEYKLCGIIAVWNQKSFRQSTVMGYSTRMDLMRPLINIYAYCSGYPSLPSKGSQLDYVNLSLICVKNNNVDIFESLLGYIHRAYRNRHDFYMIGMHETDPLSQSILKLKRIPYNSRLYVACWEDGKNTLNSLDDRIPYLEIGAI